MKTLLIVARKYNGHELWTALGVMQKEGIEFEVVSTKTTIVDEVTGQANIIERTLDEVSVDELGTEFQSLMIVSGNMADTELYWYDNKVQAIVKKAGELDIPIAAICCSVPTIRKIAKGKRVSFYPLIRSRQLLGDEGAILETVSITVDDKLVTAEHQMATQVWAECFVDVCQGKKPRLDLQDSGFKPMGKSERKLHPTLERLRGVEYHPKNIKRMKEFFEDD